MDENDEGIEGLTRRDEGEVVPKWEVHLRKNGNALVSRLGAGKEGKEWTYSVSRLDRLAFCREMSLETRESRMRMRVRGRRVRVK